MSNFRLKNPDCVLIHIPKTGGTSMRKGVWKSAYEGPVFGHIPADWQPLFKFAFVRHPFDRFVSAWKMFTVGAVGDEGWKMPADAYPLSMNEFFDIVADERIIFDENRSRFEEKIRHHTIPQTHPFNCLQLADFVGRFERIDEDFAIIAHRLGVTAPLPKMHYTEHGSWAEEIPAALLPQLRDYYHDDLEKLGYDSGA